MNRRDFIKMSVLLFPVFVIPRNVQSKTITNDTLENGLVFPFYFPEKAATRNHQQINQVKITNFKSEGFFSQLWRALSQFIK